MKKELAISRAKLLKKIREFFEKKGFIEVETPIMVKIPGMEPHLTPFETDLIVNNKKTKLFLNTSPELQMKKLLAQGFEKIFNITKVFRNGEIGGDTHNPEFTMLEWYRTNATYEDLMTDCEEMITSLIEKDKITYQNKTINLRKSWDKKTTNELFIKYCDIDLLKNKDFKTFKKTAEEKDLDINACTDWDDIFFKIFLNHIEPHLGKEKPIFVYDYPSTQAALARKKESEPFFAERFELYIGGVELCNAFSELTDEKEQQRRLEKEQIMRKKLGKTVFDIDEEFLNSLKSLRQTASGNALGVDRLLMILEDKKSIEDILLFPMTKMLKN